MAKGFGKLSLTRNVRAAKQKVLPLQSRLKCKGKPNYNGLRSVVHLHEAVISSVAEKSLKLYVLLQRFLHSLRCGRNDE